MPLPQELHRKNEKLDYERLVNYANHVQGSVESRTFVGENLEYVLDTLDALAEALKAFDQKYGKDVPDKPFGALSQLKVNKLLQEAG